MRRKFAKVYASPQRHFKKHIMPHDCAIGYLKTVENQIVVPILEIRVFYFKEPWDPV